MESRLPVIIIVLCVAALTFALPHSLAPYPKWIPLTVLIVLMALAKLAHHQGHTLWNTILGSLANAVTTLFLLWSVALLVITLPTRKESPADLLLSAGILWTTNVVVFALWYWRIDAGGPNARDRRGRHDCGAFLFPQMTLDEDKRKASSYSEWYPHFVDYLFLAFNTSTALSPTDTAVLSRWAKLMMMAQSAISLVIIVLLAARAINSLQ
ncbi:MAG: hypothetical protein H8F28_06870 [Fibrella sp.]|nr:hypothetical protein [Armatimonadota bacterium]